MRAVPVVCVLLLALAGCSEAQEGAAARVAFLAAGDYGVGRTPELALGLGMRSYESRNPADMLVFLGDNDYTESPRYFRHNWSRSFGWARRGGLRVAGVLGNHDYEEGRGRYEFGLLGMPGPYYTRQLGDAQLFLLDSNHVTGRQTRWLEEVLAESSATWKIAVMHHPPYTCGAYLGDPRILRRWVPLFEEYGVQLVLAGHDHTYQRFAARNGVTYVVHGGGGATLYRLRGCPRSYPPRARARSEHGFLSVSIGPDDLQVTAVDLKGRVRDRFTLSP